MADVPPVPLLVDCDPGRDDVVALLLAAGAPEVDLRGVTTVAGNASLEGVTETAREALAVAGREDVALAAGDPDGVELLAATLEAAAGPVALAAIGPLTDVALLLGRRPELRDRLGRVAVMGGWIDEGAEPPRAEFNASTDPAALAFVLDAGLDLTLCPYDVTSAARPTSAALAALRGLDTDLGRHVAALLAADGAGPVHDPVAVASLLDPALVATEPARVVVERGSGVTRRVPGAPPQLALARAVDVDGLWRRLVAAVDALGRPDR